MEVLPSMDLRGGLPVRLVQGDFSRQTAYPTQPIELARRYSEAGSTRLHVVDLDAAAGAGSNRELIGSLVREAGIEIQVAGGVRTAADVATWLTAGAAAVVMGTTAVRDPSRLAACAAAHPGRVIAALDVKGGRPAIAGWLETEELSLPDLLARWDVPGLAGVIVTSVDRDGTMTGPDLQTLRQVLELSKVPVTYSGGIGSLDHCRAVAAAGAASLILGRALYEAPFTLGEAIAACA